MFHHAALTFAAFVACVMSAVGCSPTKPPAAPPPTHGYLGAEACAECHAERVASFMRTGHHLTSQAPSETSIKGSFDPSGNTLRTSNPDVTFKMERRGSRFVQTVRAGDGHEVRAEPFDLVIGSAKLGQSYLFWQDRDLYQLPVSYFESARGWMNSPGEPYVDGTARFDRPVVPRCLECHATWFPIPSAETPASTSTAGDASPKNRYGAERPVLGISCERCHGPGAAHVLWHREHPAETQGRRIVRPADLPRDRSLDLCGQCHGGVGKSLRPEFSYRPGLVLEDFIYQPPVPVDAPPGMHSANQLVRLRQSRCFVESGTLTCISCHDPHTFERGNDQVFSKRCLSCHKRENCGACAKLGDHAGDDCVPCHMVREEVHSTPLATQSGTAHPVMADHKIRVDQAATKRYLDSRR